MRNLILFLILTLFAAAPTFAQEGSSPVITPENADQLTQLALLGRGIPSSVAYSPDGGQFAVGSSVGVWLYDANDYVAAPRLLAGHTGPVTDVAYAPGGAWLVSSSLDRTLMVWDVNSGEALRTLTGHTAAINRIAINPNGRTALSASNDNTLILWDLVSGKVIHVLEGHTGAVHGVDFTPDGSQAISVSNWELIGWEIASGQALGTLEPYEDISRFFVNCAIHPDGQTFVTAESGFLVLRDAGTGRMVRYFEHGSFGPTVFSPDGSMLLIDAGRSSPALLDVATGEIIRYLEGHTREVQDVAFSPDGRTALSAALSNADGVILWDVASGLPLYVFPGYTHAVPRMVLSPDGDSIAFGASNHGLWLRGIASDPLMPADEGLTLRIATPYAFSPDGQYIAGDTVLWDVDGGEIVFMFDRHSLPVRDATFSPDGTTVVTASADRTLMMWDVATGEPVRTLTGHNGWVMSVSFDSDGQTLVSSGSDGQLIQWDATTGDILQVFTGHDDAVWDVAFSPNGAMLLSGSNDGAVIVWDAASGQVIHILTGHTAIARSVAFSPDSRLAVSGGCTEIQLDDCLQGDIKVWDVEGGEELQTLAGHTLDVTDVVFTPNGTQLLSSSIDGSIRIWSVPGP